MSADAAATHVRLLTRLGHAAAALEPDALEIVVRIAERVAAGRATYGDLDLATDRRDFVAEGLAEMVDGLFYIAARTLQEARRRALNVMNDPEAGGSADRVCTGFGLV